MASPSALSSRTATRPGLMSTVGGMILPHRLLYLRAANKIVVINVPGLVAESSFSAEALAISRVLA